jgi:hypothetical protein
MNSQITNQISKRHPNADAIIAWAEGKEIQWQESGEIKWNTFGKTGPGNPFNSIDYVPDFNNQYRVWRIKPEQKTGWVTIIRDRGEIYAGNTIYPSQQDAKNCTHIEDVIAIIQITYTKGEGLEG